ncbi:hypothetical protein METP3_03573 [Methanosarcinales archaeon]|nr:hypothetical protein METP3_03573 [Methanosarcinales archaeon]
MKLRAEPYTLELRHDMKDSEQSLRGRLNLKWCDGVLFNVIAKENSDKAEYDVIQWNEQDKSILFIEYKNSVQAYKNLKAHEAQQNKDYARNIARAFCFLKYDFIIVVRSLEQNFEKVKGKGNVISLDELTNYLPEFESTLEELDYTDKLLDKYNRLENPVEFRRETVLKEMKILRDKIEQVNK